MYVSVSITVIYMYVVHMYMVLRVCINWNATYLVFKQNDTAIGDWMLREFDPLTESIEDFSSVLTLLLSE